MLSFRITKQSSKNVAGTNLIVSYEENETDLDFALQYVIILIVSGFLKFNEEVSNLKEVSI